MNLPQQPNALHFPLSLKKSRSSIGFIKSTIDEPHLTSMPIPGRHSGVQLMMIQRAQSTSQAVVPIKTTFKKSKIN
jgi:hypothetical protein